MCFLFFFALFFLSTTKRKTNENKGDVYTSEKINFDMLIIIMASRERRKKQLEFTFSLCWEIFRIGHSRWSMWWMNKCNRRLTMKKKKKKKKQQSYKNSIAYWWFNLWNLILLPYEGRKRSLDVVWNIYLLFYLLLFFINDMIYLWISRDLPNKNHPEY